MKKLFLTLLLISPLAKSEILELTCESALPFQITYNFETKEGYLIHSDNLDTIDGNFPRLLRSLKGKQSLGRLVTKGDYYVIYQRKTLNAQGLHHIYINRKNLYFWIQGVVPIFGKCKQGIHELPDYKI